MRTRLGFGLFLAALLIARAEIAVGDSAEQVLKEKGRPTGRIQAGELLVLTYADVKIKLKAGKVTAIEPVRAPRPAPRATPPAAPKRAAPPAAAPAESAQWLTDYRAALMEAKERRRNVLLFFTGSDWCSWCRRLQAEVLATPEFVRYAGDRLVLVELDFPRSHPVSAEMKAQNEDLARRYQIRGFPTVVVLDPEGRAIGRLGYEEGGPQPFIARLDAL